MRLILLLISISDYVSADNILYVSELPFNITWTTNDVHMTDIFVGGRVIANCVPLFKEAHLYHREDASTYTSSMSKDKTCVLTVKKFSEQDSLFRIRSDTGSLKAVLVNSAHVQEFNSSWAYARIIFHSVTEGLKNVLVNSVHVPEMNSSWAYARGKHYVTTGHILYVPGLPFNITWTTNDVYMADISAGAKAIATCIPLLNEANLYHREDASAYTCSITEDRTCVLTVKKLVDKETLFRIHSDTGGLKDVLINNAYIQEMNSSWAYARVKLAKRHQGDSTWRDFFSIGLLCGLVCITFCIRVLYKGKVTCFCCKR